MAILPDKYKSVRNRFYGCTRNNTVMHGKKKKTFKNQFISKKYLSWRYLPKFQPEPLS